MAKTCPLCGSTFPDSDVFCPNDGTSLKTHVEGDDLINQTFCDRYVVTECVGQGGMGAVYLARDVRLPQKVAIKVLRHRTASDPALVARFRQEAEAASRINHDRVARVFDFGFLEDGRAFLVMEYANGRTLKEMLDDGPIEPHVAARIMVMIAEGVGAAHRLGILHRDLKPDNVMVLNDANLGLRVKVLDFGIAKVLNTNGEVKTEAGFVIGTPLWMSPEQLLAEPLDARSDIYALGLLAFAMLTGTRAFSGGTRQSEMMAPLSVAPRLLHAALPAVQWPPELQSLITRTLSRRASERPASALEFANEMARLINNSSLPTARVVALVPPSNNAKLVAITTAVAAAVILVVFAFAKWNGPVVTRTSVATSDGAASAVALPVAANGQAPTVAAIDSNAPTATVSSAVTPNAGTPNAGTPNATTPNVPTPNATTPNATTPNATMSNATTGNATTGNAGSPNAAVPTANAAQPSPSIPSNPNGRVAATRAPGADVATKNGEGDIAQLHRLMSETDASVAAGLSDAAQRSRARELLRDLAALKLTAPADQGWALLYKGMAHATLNEKQEACAAFDAASKVKSPSSALSQNIEQWLATLSCPP